MKWLQDLLVQLAVPQETQDKVMEEAGKQKMIPKERFDAINGQLKEANKTLANVNTELETLKGSAASSEVLKQQLSDLQKKNTDLVTDYEGKIKEMKVRDYVKGEMSKSLKDDKYFDLLYKEIDHSKLVMGEDGSVTGFDINQFQEKYPDLFGEEQKGLGSLGKPPVSGKKGEEMSIGKMLAGLGSEQSVEKQNLYF